jgi:hypothetical protein
MLTMGKHEKLGPLFFQVQWREIQITVRRSTTEPSKVGLQRSKTIDLHINSFRKMLGNSDFPSVTMLLIGWVKCFCVFTVILPSYKIF